MLPSPFGTAELTSTPGAKMSKIGALLENCATRDSLSIAPTLTTPSTQAGFDMPRVFESLPDAATIATLRRASRLTAML